MRSGWDFSVEDPKALRSDTLGSPQLHRFTSDCGWAGRHAGRGWMDLQWKNWLRTGGKMRMKIMLRIPASAGKGFGAVWDIL